MKIEDNNGPDGTRVQDLQPGDIFFHEHATWMKLAWPIFLIGAEAHYVPVLLCASGRVESLHERMMVHPLPDATLVLYPKKLPRDT